MYAENLKTSGSYFSQSINFYQRQSLETPLLEVEAGLPQGAITQICGFGKSEAALQIIKDNSEFKAAWIESNQELNPLTLSEENIDMAHFICKETGEHMIGLCQRLIKSNLYPLIILKSAPLDDFLLRKLQLTVEKSQTALVILTEDFSSSWPISLMLKAQRHQNTESISIEVLRQ